MSLPEEFSTLLATEMDRKEFLAYCGAALLAVIGVSGLLRALTHPPALAKRPASTGSMDGYSGGVYGGHR